MDKLSKITGQLGNPAVIETVLGHLDRLLGGEAQTTEHILSCYRHLPQARSAEIVRYDIQHNRVNAVIAITGEMNGTTYSWDNLCVLATRGRAHAGSSAGTGQRGRDGYYQPQPEWTEGAFQDIFEKMYENYRRGMQDDFGEDLERRMQAQREREAKEREEREAARRRRNRTVIRLDTAENPQDVTASVRVIEERTTRKGDDFLVVELQASEDWYEIQGIAYIFDRTTINAVRKGQQHMRLRISPSLDPKYPPKVRKVM